VLSVVPAAATKAFPPRFAAIKGQNPFTANKYSCPRSVGILASSTPDEYPGIPADAVSKAIERLQAKRQYLIPTPRRDLAPIG
jgi:hypothetical protein